MTPNPHSTSVHPVTPRYALLGTVFSDGVEDADTLVILDGDRIAYAGPPAACPPGIQEGAERVNVPVGGAILPGLIDLHCHGAIGADFPSGDEQSSRSAVEFLHDHGTTTLLCSLVTAPPRELLRAISDLKPLVNEGLVAGVHLEGPFLSKTKCGAQDPAWLCEPDFSLLDKLLQAADGVLRTMTYAPELQGAEELVRKLASNGIIPSLGHTDCSSEVAEHSLRAAGRALRRLPSAQDARPTVTHLFNGMPPMHHRAPGPVSACLRLARQGAVVVELIGDGVHLDPQTMQTTFELVGAENVALVTDSMAATGLPDGCYELGPSQVFVEHGVARLKNGTSLAGGTATLLDVVRATIRAGVAPAEAVLSATAVPARLVGVHLELGSIKTGMRADLVVVDSGYRAVSVVRGGSRRRPVQHT